VSEDDKSCPTPATPGSPIGHNNQERSRYWLRTNNENLEVCTHLLTAHVFTLPSDRFLTYTKGQDAKAYDRRLDRGSWERLARRFNLSHLGKQCYVQSLGESWFRWGVSGIGNLDDICFKIGKDKPMTLEQAISWFWPCNYCFCFACLECGGSIFSVRRPPELQTFLIDSSSPTFIQLGAPVIQYFRNLNGILFLLDSYPSLHLNFGYFEIGGQIAFLVQLRRVLACYS
jgi:hypothetical protein